MTVEALTSAFSSCIQYVREVFRLLGDGMAYENLGEDILHHAILWIRFVVERCEGGRGTNTRWAINRDQCRQMP